MSRNSLVTTSDHLKLINEVNLTVGGGEFHTFNNAVCNAKKTRYLTVIM